MSLRVSSSFAALVLAATALGTVPVLAKPMSGAAAIKAIDTDNDGTIDLKEAQAVAGALFDKLESDKDGTVDPDERLRITGVPPGTYDVRLKDVSGRQCVVRGIKVEAGEIFSIEEKQLTSCQ